MRSLPRLASKFKVTLRAVSRFSACRLPTSMMTMRARERDNSVSSEKGGPRWPPSFCVCKRINSCVKQEKIELLELGSRSQSGDAADVLRAQSVSTDEVVRCSNLTRPANSDAELRKMKPNNWLRKMVGRGWRGTTARKTTKTGEFSYKFSNSEAKILVVSPYQASEDDGTRTRNHRIDSPVL